MRWSCKNETCKKFMYHHSKNRHGLCEECFRIAGLLKWLLDNNVLRDKNVPQETEAGIWIP